MHGTPQSVGAQALNQALQFASRCTLLAPSEPLRIGEHEKHVGVLDYPSRPLRSRVSLVNRPPRKPFTWSVGKQDIVQMPIIEPQCYVKQPRHSIVATRVGRKCRRLVSEPHPGGK